MKAQHTNLQDGTGAGIGLILSQNIKKRNGANKTRSNVDS